MALPATDNFNRIDANPIGGNWTTTPGENAIQITNNRAFLTGNPSGCYWNADAFNDNQYSKATVTLNVTGRGVTGRVSAIATTYYLLWINNTTTLEVYKCIAGTFTKLGSTYTGPFAVDDIIKLSVSGQTLTPNVNGTDLSTQTDSAITSGSPGMRFGDGTLDNWEGGNIDISGLSIPVAQHHLKMMRG